MTRKYHTSEKTTTMAGKKDYQQQYMVDYRKRKKTELKELLEFAKAHGYTG